MQRVGSAGPQDWLRGVIVFSVLSLASSCSGNSHTGSAHPETVSSSAPAAPSTTTTLSRPLGALATLQSHVTISGKGRPFSVFIVAPTGRGPYPLVVWSHGYGSTAEAYTSFLESVASEGYVVAGPDFPNPDFTTHPADVSRTIDQLIQPGALRTRIDPARIAVAGHSLGGLDVLGVAYNTCCRDPRITAALTFEGPLLDFPHGHYTWSAVPLLMVLGTADSLIGSATGTDVIRHFQHDAYLLTIRGGQHGGGLDARDVGYASVQATVRDFLAAYLYNDTAALAELRSHTNRTDTTLTQR